MFPHVLCLFRVGYTGGRTRKWSEGGQKQHGTSLDAKMLIQSNDSKIIINLNRYMEESSIIKEFGVPISCLLELSSMLVWCMTN